MARHDPDEVVTAYFVVKKDGNKSIIQAWSESKNMVESYMEFHNCKMFHVKKVECTANDMYEKFEENLHDEIELFNISTRDSKHKHEIKSITIPATTTEISLLNDETNTLAASMIRYSYINDAIPYLKSKYQKALTNIGLIDFINKSLHERRSAFVDNVQFDQLILLYKLFNENFD